MFHDLPCRWRDTVPQLGFTLFAAAVAFTICTLALTVVCTVYLRHLINNELKNGLICRRGGHYFVPCFYFTLVCVLLVSLFIAKTCLILQRNKPPITASLMCGSQKYS